MTQPIASLSLDLDNKWSYLKTHGDQGWESFPSYLDALVPRFVELLQNLGLRITVFVVGQDAAIRSNHAALSSLVAAGHGIGNHSFHHEPWLHLYSPADVEDEICAAEEAIFSATGVTPLGFRGPGYSLSATVLECLARRGYRYDASTLPSLIGPLARSYYFARARLSGEERRRRNRLFGTWTDGLKPIRPYRWQVTSADGRERQLLELPITTLPVCRVPIHFSYILFLRQTSRIAAWSYWRWAMNSCRLLGVEPSLLLHPLDLLGGDEEPELRFFPAMKLPGAAKREFVHDLLEDFSRCFRVLPLDEYAAVVAQRTGLKSVIIANTECGVRNAECPPLPPPETPHSEFRAPHLPVETISQ